MGMEEDPSIIFWLEPLSQRAIEVFSHSRNRDHFEAGYSAPSFRTRDVTPATDAGEIPGEHDNDENERGGLSHRLVYRFRTKRKDPKRGIVFGSSRSCDTFLGQPEEGISGRHFKMGIDNQKRRYLESDSTVEMSVSYNGEAKDEYRRKYLWILFPDCQLKVKMKGIIRNGMKLPDLEFSIHVPAYVLSNEQHEMLLGDYVEEVRKANEHYIRESGTLDLHLLDINPTTAAGSGMTTPKKGRIYARIRQIGRGLSGIVYQARDVSNGQICAMKELYGNVTWRREVEVTKSLSHVRILNHSLHFSANS